MDSLRLKGKYNFKIIRNGIIVDDWNVDNLITSAGKAEMANLAGNVSTPASFTYIASGTSSSAVAVGQTALQGTEFTTIGLTRAAGTATRTTTTVTNDTMNLTKTFSITGSGTVEEVGVFNAASTGTMLSRVLTGSKSLVNGDQFVVTYTIAFA